MADSYFTEETFDLLRKLQAKPEDKEWLLSLDQEIALSSELKAKVEDGDLSEERNEMRKKFYGQHEDKDEGDEEGGGDGRFRNCVKNPFDEKLIKRGVWEKLQKRIRSRFESPHNHKKTFGQDVISGYPQQKWFALYSKQQKGDDPKRSGPRIVLVLTPDHLKVAFMSDDLGARKRLKRDWNNLERSRQKEIESKISSINVDSEHLEYWVGQSKSGTERVDSLQHWVEGQMDDCSDDNWATEIRLMIPKDVVLNTDSDVLEQKVADAIEALFPIYELAVDLDSADTVDLDSADTNAANYARVAVDKDKHANVLQIKELLEKERQVILTGPPGTSKTYTAFQVVSAFQSGGSHVLEGERPYEGLIDCQFGQANEDQNVIWDIVQFHQSYGYEDFVSGIEASSAQDQDGLKLERVDKVFLSMCEKAKNALNAHDGDADKAPKYVLIIDEINRGILGRIFGELILGLEYRGLPIRLQGRNGENGEDNEKKDTITIPDNLYLIGTMNTADRNIALVDHALRRRFRFVDMPPSKAVLGEVLGGYIKDENKPLQKDNRKLILEVFNEVQDLFKDNNSARAGAIDKKNYSVGHTYFMCDTIEDFWGNMHYQVLPLLDEYVREGILRSEQLKGSKQLKGFANDLRTDVAEGAQSNDRSIEGKIAEWCEKWEGDSNDT